MPYKVRQKQRDYDREWHRRKRDNESTRIVNKMPLTEEERRYRKQFRSNKANRERRKRNRTGIAAILGNRCIFCGSTKNPQTHKIDGEKHATENGGVVKLEDVIKNPYDYAPLCHLCHKAVHWVMKYFGMTWEEILEKANIYKLVKTDN